MKIVTLTLNPAFDVHCRADGFKPYLENLAEIVSTDAGGKGVNISRALSSLGVESTALILLGEENSELFVKQLKEDGVCFRTVNVSGRIRENLTLHSDGDKETRISFSGFTADENILKGLEDMLGDELPGTVVTFTGRSAPGISTEALRDFLLRLKSKGARLVIDSRSVGISELTDIKPWLIKPNAEEIAMYTDLRVSDAKSALSAARELHGRGIENVMISLGGDGAVLYCEDGGFFCEAPRITPHSTVGAGDSSLAGFIAAAHLGLPYEERLRYAVCSGSAACLAEGTRPPRAEDITALLTKASVKRPENI